MRVPWCARDGAVRLEVEPDGSSHGGRRCTGVGMGVMISWVWSEEAGVVPGFEATFDRAMCSNVAAEPFRERVLNGLVLGSEKGWECGGVLTVQIVCRLWWMLLDSASERYQSSALLC